MIINKDIYKYSFTILICLVFLFISGCVSSGTSQYRLPKDKRIAVIPFTSLISGDHDQTRGGDESLQIEQLLTSELVSQLKNKELSNIILLKSIPDDVSVKQINPGVIITGKIFRYKERKGSRYAVSYPASVAFKIKIIDPISGNVVSQYEYNETQQALSENLFNLKKFVMRKGRWVKAIELAIYGISEFVNIYTD